MVLLRKQVLVAPSCFISRRPSVLFSFCYIVYLKLFSRRTNTDQIRKLGFTVRKVSTFNCYSNRTMVPTCVTGHCFFFYFEPDQPKVCTADRCTKRDSRTNRISAVSWHVRHVACVGNFIATTTVFLEIAN